MGLIPQLIMRHPNITDIPPLVLPEGFTLHTHVPGQEQVWEEIIESAFGAHFDFDFLIKAGDYHPKHVLYISKNGVDIATTSAVENPAYPGEGWFRMVGVHQDARGMGVGRMIALAALHALKDRGYKSACLSTDDARIPALSLYLSLGFEPVYSHESHKERWERVFEILNSKQK